MAVYRHASCGDHTRMTGNTERRLLAPNFRCYWQQIAAEIQRYGINTLMSLALLRQGVAYWNTLEDVCDKLDVNYNVKSSTEAIEPTLSMKLPEKNLDQMTQKELATFSRNMQLDQTNPTPQLIIMVVQATLRTSFLTALELSTMQSTSVGWHRYLGHSSCCTTDQVCYRRSCCHCTPFSMNDFQHYWLGLPSHYTGLHYRDLTLSATYFPLIHFLPTTGWSGYFLQGAFIMPKQEHRYDRLAIRLAILVSRLFMGESLNISQLAQEFGVSGRTVQRDLRERLRYLDTEYIDGHVSLRDARGPFRTNSDILRFAQITSVAHYFPVLDPKLLSVLLDNRQDPPCIVWNDPPRQAPALFDGFQVIVQSIIRNRLIRFLHREHLQSSIAPYRLICHDGEWYLAAVSKDHIQVFTLSAITDVVMTTSSFARNRHIDRILQDPRFMRALPHFDYISGIIHK